MNRRPDDPLSAEERALAELLGRDAATEQAQPSAALDAAVLGAARDAVRSQDSPQTAHEASAPELTTAAPPRSRTRAHHRQRRQRRWSLGAGTAAAVLLAVTLAWQLRPQPEVAVVREAPPPAALMAPAPAEAPGTAEDAVAQSAVEPAPPAASEAGAEAPPARAPESQPKPRVAVQARRPTKPAPAPAIDVPEPRPTDIVTPPAPPSPPAPTQELMAAPPPPPPPAPAAPSPDVAAPATLNAYREHDTAQLSRANAKASRAMQAKMAEAEDEGRNEGARTQRVMRTDTLVPVTDDSLLSREDWIERIRTRYGLGDVLSARRSLQLFVQIHPRDKVPDDLQPLLTP